MHLRSDSFKPYDWLDAALAFGQPGDDSPFAFGGNRNPHLAWSGAPEATRSFAILCCDSDVPSDGTDVNQPGRSVPIDLPRVDFFHWVLCDLPADQTEIVEGSHAAGIVARGKPPGAAPGGGIQGVNDYTAWFADDAEMAGDYGGYDGPCPPWNDERIHGYRFSVYALDLLSLGLSGAFGGQQLREAMQGHLLAEAHLLGLYSMNPGR